MKPVSTAILTAVLLAGCQAGVSIREDTFGEYRRIEAAQVVLHQDLRFPAGKARVYLQNEQAGQGLEVLPGGFDSYQPHCAFEIRSVDHAGFVVRAETFPVTRIQRTTVQVVDAAPVAPEPLRVAAVGMLGSLLDGGSASFYDGFHFWLASETQPDVMRMTCYGVYAQPYELYPPTLGEINAVLGAVAELRYR